MMRLRNARLISIFAPVILLAISSAIADVAVSNPPFYYAGATAVEPQIASLIVGVNESIGRAVVSHDRKYVTLDVDPTLSNSLGIKTFTFQKSSAGFVGSAAATAGTPGAISGSIQASQNSGSLTPTIAALPSDLARPLPTLEKPGMTFIAPISRQ